jgi:hypothetical protein
MTGTPASLYEENENSAEPVKDHERLKKILNDKRKQLPKAYRGIITLEVTEQFMLSDFSVETAAEHAPNHVDQNLEADNEP